MDDDDNDEDKENSNTEITEGMCKSIGGERDCQSGSILNVLFEQKLIDC